MNHKGPYRSRTCIPQIFFFFFQAEDGIRDLTVTGVQTCALPISILPPDFTWLFAFIETPPPSSFLLTELDRAHLASGLHVAPYLHRHSPPSFFLLTNVDHPELDASDRSRRLSPEKGFSRVTPRVEGPSLACVPPLNSVALTSLVGVSR